MPNTGDQAILQIEADAAAYGFRKTPDVNGKIRWFVTCSNCGKDDSIFHASLRNADHLINHFTKRGWTFNRKESQHCSTQCARQAKAKHQAERKEEAMKQPTFTVPPPPTSTAIPAPSVASVTAIGSDIRLTLRVGGVIEEHFDRDKRLYHSGWSDDRVAKESGAALDFAIKVRKEGFGELAEDPEWGKLRDDIKATGDLFSGQLQALERSFATQLTELKARLDRLTQTHNKAGG